MKKTGGYHHGNTRAALIEAAHARLEQDGHESLSLRALAAEIGVAPSAPYNHFKSRNELLATLLAEGALALAGDFRAASESPGRPLDRLELACLAYLAFARERPKLFRLIFGPTAIWNMAYGRAGEAMTAYGVFERLVRETMPAAEPLAVNAATIALWAMVHGMAVLQQNQRLDRRYVAGQSDSSVLRLALRRWG